MEASVTIKVSPQEFDTLREAVNEYFGANFALAKPASSASAQERHEASAKAAKAKHLLERMQ